MTIDAAVAPQDRVTIAPTLGRRLAILGGAEASVLDRVPSETGRFIQLFFVLLGTATLSSVSMGFALITGVRIAPYLAVPMALLWGALIFTIDRFLTSTMKAGQSRGLLVALAVPRAIMAVVIGVVVAEPLVLQVFQSDIAREIASTNLINAQADQSRVDQGPEKAALNAATSRLHVLQEQAATGVVPGTSTNSAAVTSAQAAVDALNQQLSAQAPALAKSRALYECEVHGTGAGTVPGCSGIAGPGPSTDAARADFDQQQSVHNNLVRRLQQAQNILAAAQDSSQRAAAASEGAVKAAAQKQLPSAQAADKSALAAYDAQSSSIAAGNQNATGLLSQINGLNELSAKNPALGVAHFFVAALFLTVEVLPIVSKLAITLGGPTLYDEVEDLAKRSKIAVISTDTDDETWRAEKRREMRRRVEEDMLRREQELGELSNEYVAKGMTKVLDIALADWSSEVDAMLKSNSRKRASLSRPGTAQDSTPLA